MSEDTDVREGGDAAAGPGETDPAATAEEDGSEAVAPEDAFARLGNETRLRTVRELADADDPPTFTDLFEATDEDTTAGFAYHLRQLTGHYVEKVAGDDADRYRLTSAGRAVARALRAGTYTDRVARGPDDVDGDCPVCGSSSLSAGLDDNLVTVACRACDTALLTLPFPPAGARPRDTDDLLDAFDAYHRRRLALVGDGVCPDCAGRARGRIESAPAPESVDGGDADADAADERPTVVADCEDCPFSLRAPVSLAVRDHPAVVAFFADHDAEPGPIWNLGPEWSEATLSTEPWAVRVSVALDHETLHLYVGDGPTVVEHERVGGEGA